MFVSTPLLTEQFVICVEFRATFLENSKDAFTRSQRRHPRKVNSCKHICVSCFLADTKEAIDLHNYAQKADIEDEAEQRGAGAGYTVDCEFVNCAKKFIALIDLLFLSAYLAGTCCQLCLPLPPPMVLPKSYTCLFFPF